MIPAFCPNPNCHFHYSAVQDETDWWIHFGSHETKVVGRVPRYQCKFCKKTFCDRTYHIDYFAKKTISYKEIETRLASAESMSAMARNLSVSPVSIQNRIERLARNCLALHHKLTESLHYSEHLVADGFESFDRSQFFPNNINILVGQKSQFIYGKTHTTIRRKGTMTDKQKEMREKYEKTWKAPRGGIRNSFEELVNGIPYKWDKEKMPELKILTDEQKDYPKAINAVPLLKAALDDKSFVHEKHSSKIPRTIVNPLFPVNYIDRELRKDIPAYHRESTCFCRNVSNGMLRFSVYQNWHNYRKPYRVWKTDLVHAVFAGIDQEKITDGLSRLYQERAFYTHVFLSNESRRIWLKEAMTPLNAKPDRIPKHVKGSP